MLINPASDREDGDQPNTKIDQGGALAARPSQHEPAPYLHISVVQRRSGLSERLRRSTAEQGISIT